MVGLGIVDLLIDEIARVCVDCLRDGSEEPATQAEEGEYVEKHDERLVNLAPPNELIAIVAGHDDHDCDQQCIDGVEDFESDLLRFS